MDVSLPAYRVYMLELVRKLFGDEYKIPEKGFDQMNEVFKEAGGSWYALIQGDSATVVLLRDTVKAGKKKGFVLKGKS